MARDKALQEKIDKSNLLDYPNARIKDNSGSDDGTPVDEMVYGDIHEFFAYLMRNAAIFYNGLPDNTSNGYQLIDALKGFANKNSFVLSIGSANGKLTVNTKLGTLKDNETFVCKASVNLGNESKIRGTDNTERSISKKGNFLNGEYVRLINTQANIVLVRLTDNISIDNMGESFDFLKAATTQQDIDGELDTVATTPMGNLLAFAEWVNGVMSAASLATAIRNGLYPKEHFQIVENIGQSNVRNIGYVSGLDIGGGNLQGLYAVGGDINQAKLIYKNGGCGGWELSFENAMDNNNYYIRIFSQTQGNPDADTETQQWVFKPLTTTKAQIYNEESISTQQNIKIFVEVVQF